LERFERANDHLPFRDLRTERLEVLPARKKNTWTKNFKVD